MSVSALSFMVFMVGGKLLYSTHSKGFPNEFRPAYRLVVIRKSLP